MAIVFQNSINPLVLLMEVHCVLCDVLTEYLYVTAGFRREVDENCPVLGYYAASSGN
jgi:hypothetical protein